MIPTERLQGTCGLYTLWHIGINMIHLCVVFIYFLVNQLSVSFVCYKIFC